MPDVFVSDDNQPLPEKQHEELNKPAANPLPFFSAYSHLPHGIKFTNQEPDEHVVLFLRRHFTKNVSWILMSILFILLPFALFFIPDLLPMIQSVIPFTFMLIFISFYYLIIIGFIFNNFIIWFYNLGIVTNKQIIDMDFTDIMYREVAKANIRDVVDVEFRQGGFLHSFFDFGDVFIQTEGVKPNFEFISIPHPDKVSDIILDLKKSTR